jgi:hypothetical protein
MGFNTLSWDTYYALPVLRNYEQALKHFNEVVPIRRDVGGTKPVGRRDQKWLAIYKRERDNAVCIGSRWNKGEDRPLLAYHPDGRVSIQQSVGTTCRERIQRIAGINIQRKFNENWVHAVTYQDGKEVVGDFPLKTTYRNPRTLTFILRENATPIYLNPIPAVTHIIDRKNKAEVKAKFKEFIAYVKNMSKLLEGNVPRLQRSEMFAAFEIDNNQTKNYHTFQLFKGYYGSQTDEHADRRKKLLAMASSGDLEQMYKAMLWLSFVAMDDWRSNGYAPANSCLDMFDKAMMVQHKDEVLIRTEVRDGRIVKDRYANYQHSY